MSCTDSLNLLASQSMYLGLSQRMLQAAEEDSVDYIPWDFKYFAKLRGNQILEDMQPVIRKALNVVGMYVCPPSSPCPEANRKHRVLLGETPFLEMPSPWSLPKAHKTAVPCKH